MSEDAPIVLTNCEDVPGGFVTLVTDDGQKKRIFIWKMEGELVIGPPLKQFRMRRTAKGNYTSR